MVPIVPVISIVGKSKAGKTSLLERLVPELRGRGYSVAVVKHTRQDFELDRPGKDSWRLAQTGAEAAFFSSPKKLVMVKAMEHDASLEELSPFIGADFDLIFTEGYRHDKAPKIEVHRKELGSDLLCSPEELLAVVTNEPMDISVTRFSMDDINSLADFIEHKFLSKRQDNVALFINDKVIPLNPFVKEFLIKTLLGMVSALKGVKEIRKLDIWLRQRGERRQ